MEHDELGDHHGAWDLVDAFLVVEQVPCNPHDYLFPNVLCICDIPQAVRTAYNTHRLQILEAGEEGHAPSKVVANYSRMA